LLPINDSTGKGEGYVTYSIKPANNTKTGDSLYAKASIIFDGNAAIETPQIFNTIDAAAPTSSIDSIKRFDDSTEITLRWHGSDDVKGSGVHSYKIFVSQNGSPFKIYQSGLKDTSFIFNGTYGNQYQFFTLATDNVGNEEEMKSAAEVGLYMVPTLRCLSNLAVSSEEGSCTIQIEDIDPLVDASSIDSVKYILSGATSKTGIGSASGILFNKGVTTVTYKLLSDTNKVCSFTVTVNAIEICNGLDDDCDGMVDEGFERIIYRDLDADGFGNTNDTLIRSICVMPGGYALKGGDCDNNNASIYPGTSGCEECVTDSVVFAARSNNATIYQWQVNRGIGFEDIFENSNYSGVTSKYLVLSKPLTSWQGYKYRCTLTTSDSTTYSPEYTLKFTFTWKGDISNIWENPLNWNCNTVPDEHTDVILSPAKPVILNSNAKVRTLTIPDGSHITVNPGYTLEVKK
jgi:hypothetical protein